jgi:hypothetical protein
VKRIIPVLALLVTTASAQFYDHVTITADSLVARFAPLSACIRTELGLTDTIVTVEAIHASFSGRDTPEKIRNFIRYAYDNWVTMYVLLGGDVEVVPPRYAWANCGSGPEPVPSDLYYSALDGDWDADDDGQFGEAEDSVDLYPDIFVGRCPATTDAFVAIVVGKFVTYVSNPQAQYLDRVLLSGFDLYAWCIAEEAMEFYDSAFVPEQMKPCAKVYDSNSGDHRIELVSDLNAGPHIWVHSDHSGWNCLGAGWTNHRWVLSCDDLGGLVNQDRLTIFMTNGCDVGAFDSSDCLAECFILAPNGGGVAAFSNTRTGLLDASKPLHGQSFMQMEELLRAWFSHPREASLADLATVQALVAPLAAVSERHRWTDYIFALLGEPAMPVWLPPGSGVEGSPKPQAASCEFGPTVVRGALFLPGDRRPKTGDRRLAGAARRNGTQGDGPQAGRQRRAGCCVRRLLREFAVRPWDGEGCDSELGG